MASRQYSREDARRTRDDDAGMGDDGLIDLLLVSTPLKNKITADKSLSDALRAMQSAGTEPEVRAQWNVARPLLADAAEKAGALDSAQKTMLLIKLLRKTGSSGGGGMNTLALVLLINNGGLGF